MVILLITSFFLLAAIIFAVYRWQSTENYSRTERSLPPPRNPVGLFDEEETGARPLRSLKSAESRMSDEARTALLARANDGERSVLLEAHASGDAALYEEVLNALVGRAVTSDSPDKSLLSLASFVTRHENLCVNRRLAAAFIESWKSAPDRGSTAKMLHVAALANDAGLYQQAVETAFEFWRDGRLREITAEELRTLADGEYWVLSPEARASGAGFLLKRTLAKVRRELEIRMRAS